MKMNSWLICGLAWLAAASLFAQEHATNTGTPASRRGVSSTMAKDVVLDPPVLATVNQDSLNVRGRPNFSGDIITHVPKGQSVTVFEKITLAKPTLNEPSNWARIALPPNAAVWVFASYIDTNTMTVSARHLNVRSGPADLHDLVATLDKGTPVKQIRRVPDWIQIEPPTNAFGWVAADYLTIQHPVAPTTPPTVVVAETPPPAPPVIAPAAPAPAAPAPAVVAVPPAETTPAVVAPPAAPAATPAVSATSPAPAPEPPATPPAAPSTPEVATTRPPSAPAQPIIAPEPTASSSGGTATNPAAPQTSPKPAPPESPSAAPAKPTAPEKPELSARRVPAPRSSQTRAVAPPAPAGNPASPAPEVKARTETREGIVRRTINVQAPTDYELLDVSSRQVVEYLQPDPAGKDYFKIYTGRHVFVTGLEWLDRRWPKTPVLEVKNMDVVP